jgi:acetyltransferase-like isoleucine patch superfamily enzyme
MTGFVKSGVGVLATLLVVPAYLLYRLGAIASSPERAFPGFSQTMSLIPGLTGVYIRNAFYRLVLPRCADGASLGFGTVLSHPTAEVGRRVYVGVYCCLGDVSLDDDVLLGSHVSVMNGNAQHGIDRLDLPVREQSGSWIRVTIGRDSWVGERAVVMADVGRHCVVGAGSVVTRPVPDFAVVIGAPARIIRYRDGRSGRTACNPSNSTISRTEEN